MSKRITQPRREDFTAHLMNEGFVIFSSLHMRISDIFYDRLAIPVATLTINFSHYYPDA